MTFRPRTVVVVATILVGLAAALWIVWTARQVLSWVVVAIFLALALNPAVEWLQRRGMQRRGSAAAVIYLLTISVLVGLGFLLVPPLVEQVRGFVEAAPGYVDDLTKGRGPLGELEREYGIVDRLRELTGGEGGMSGAETALNVGKGVLTAIAAIVTIAFMTFFMILEGPTWMQRIYALAPEGERDRWEDLGRRIAQTVSGYVTGNLLISLIAGAATVPVLYACGVPYPIALGLLVAVLDLVPLAGATIAGIIVITVAFLTSTTAGIVVAIFIVLYQQVENHLLQPLVYGRTVELSPLAVLVAVLVGANVAGILGALMAIPVAGTIQILLVDWRAQRARRARALAPLDEDGQPVVDLAHAGG